MIATVPTISESRFQSIAPRFPLQDFLISVPRHTPTSAKRVQDQWLELAYEQLVSIGELAQGWDSYGAAAPAADAIDGAWNLLQSLRESEVIPKPHIYPARSGGVQFEWENGDRYFEIEVVAEKEAKYFYSDESAQSEVVGVLYEGDSLDIVLDFIERVNDG